MNTVAFQNILSLAMLFLVPVGAFAAGAHDGLECTGCHALHTAKDGFLFLRWTRIKRISIQDQTALRRSDGALSGLSRDAGKGRAGNQADRCPYRVTPTDSPR